MAAPSQSQHVTQLSDACVAFAGCGDLASDACGEVFHTLYRACNHAIAVQQKKWVKCEGLPTDKVGDHPGIETEGIVALEDMRKACMAVPDCVGFAYRPAQHDLTQMWSPKQSGTDVDPDSCRPHSAGETWEWHYIAPAPAAAANEAEIDDVVKQACVIRLAQLAEHKKVLKRQVDACLRQLSALPGWATHTQSVGAIIAAKGDMFKFMLSLHNLGSAVGAPLRDHRVLCAMLESTQKIINVVLRDDKEARILTQKAEIELNDVATEIKQRHRASVEKYFQGITWTELGVAAFEPKAPFNRDTCAVNLIPSTFKRVATEYQDGKTEKGDPETEDLQQATLDIANLAVQRVQQQILQNMHLFEEAALQEFEDQMWTKIKGKVDRLSPIEVSRFKNAMAAVSMVGGVVTGFAAAFAVLSAGSAAVAAGTTTSVFATAGWLTAGAIGSAVAIVPLCAGAAYLIKDHVGWWSWDTCEAQAFKELMKSLETGQADLSQAIIQSFDKHVDNIMQKLREFRLPIAPGRTRERLQTLLTRSAC